MKKKIILFAAAVAAMACAATVVSVCSSTANSNPVFEANIETLSNGEVSAGPLCMQDQDRLCIYPDGFKYNGVWDV